MDIFKNLRNASLKSKLVLIYFITIFIPLAAVSQAILTLSTDKIISQTIELNKTAARQLSGNIRDLAEQYVDIVNRICYDNRLASYLDPAADYPSPLEVWDVYTKYLKPTTFYESTIMRNTLKIFYHNTKLNQDYRTFIFADEEVQESAVYKNAVSAAGQPVWCLEGAKVYMAKALMGRNDEMIAVVSVEIPEDRIYSLIRQSTVQEKTVIVCDRSGLVISSNDRSMVGSNVKGREFFAENPGDTEELSEYIEAGARRVIYEPLPSDRAVPQWMVITLVPVDNILQESRNLRNIGMLVCALCLLISCVIFVFFLDKIIKRVKALANRMKDVEGGNFVILDCKPSNDEIGLMTQRFNKMVESLKQLIFENYEARLQVKDIAIKKKEAELYALQSQINPHFLFNTLESVRMKLRNNSNEEASDMLLNLSRILRKSLYWKGEIITLGEEMDFVRSYLEIQKMRFKDKIDFEIRIPDGLTQLKIPKLVIQPLIENAIVHGMERKRDPGKLSVAACVRDGTVEIVIADDGMGIEEARLKRILEELQCDCDVKKEGSIGLRNINDRLVLHYGSGSALSICSAVGCGTVVTVRIPADGMEGELT